jgi:hypothetical protein
MSESQVQQSLDITLVLGDITMQSGRTLFLYRLYGELLGEDACTKFFVRQKSASRCHQEVQMVYYAGQRNNEDNNSIINKIISIGQRPLHHQKNTYHSENYHEYLY